jgi:rare lipoprotein A
MSALLVCLLLASGCSGGGYQGKATSVKVGKPYQIGGQWYHPQMVDHYREVGVASWYGLPFHGRKTANGEVYDMHGMTAAHPTLQLPSLARVTNLRNGRSIVVRVNDRGPFAKQRIIDLSRRAAWELGFKDDGTTDVEVIYMGLADGLDRRYRQARQQGPVASLN